MEHRFLAKMHCIALQYLSLGMYFKVLNSEQWKQKDNQERVIVIVIVIES